MSLLYKRKRLIRLIAVTLLTSGAVAVMLAHQTRQLSAAQIRSLAEWVALGYAALGLLFFIANRFGMMIVCMGCAAAICFYFVELAC